VGQSNSHFIFSILWKASNLLGHKIFFWLLLHDRVNTRNLLKRKSMFLNLYECALCNDKTEETSLHLFWDCPFSMQCWNSI
uniref:Reverse transcriptase zinc-binding domain-containing protein n=1 Tax=Triticum urartu TaxID=4572 RepID=A0A8R7TS57_TRIUA